MDEKPKNVEEIKSAEVLEVEDRARSFMGAFIGDLAYDLNEGLYVRDKRYNAPEEPSGGLAIRDVVEFVGIFQEIGMENFDVTLDGEGFPTLTYIDPRGRCFKASYKSTQYSEMRETHYYLEASDGPDTKPSVLLHHAGVLAHTTNYHDEAHIMFTSKIGRRARDITFTYDEDAGRNFLGRVVAKIDKWWNGY